MSLAELEEQFEKAVSLNNVSAPQSTKIYQTIISTSSQADVAASPADSLDVNALNALKERSIYALAEIFSRSSNIASLRQLFIDIRPFFGGISKAKTGKILRTLIDKTSRIAGIDYAVLISLCADCIAWCKAEKRTFLKQQIECRLCEYYLLARQYQDALKLCNRLVFQVKKLDDKHLLVEIHLIESKIHHSLHNIAKAKSALTACRAAANSIYIGPLSQAQIDMQAGSISSEERDYKTSYSYFYEAFEGFDGLKDARASKALKYMLLSKVMNDQPQDVKAVIAGKLAIKYQLPSVGIMQQIANAYQQRSLAQFEVIINAQENAAEIAQDLVVKYKLEELKNKLLEQNLLRLLEPFEIVEIAHIAQLIALPVDAIQRKLSQMILDKKFNGILDQGTGSIIVFDEEPTTTVYTDANQTIEVINDVVDQLFDKANLLD